MHYTLRYTTIVKRNYLEKLNITKNALIFLSGGPDDHRFTFNSQFIYKLKHMI